MLFDRPSELPVATVRGRGASAVSAGIQQWMVARWRWFRPRTIPVLVAILGMLAVMGSAHYLSNLAHSPPERIAAPTLLLQQDVAQLHP